MEKILKELAELSRFSKKSIPEEIILLLLILGVIIFVWDLLDRRLKRINTESGLEKNTNLVSLRGSSLLPSREYQSARLGIASKPDALAKEDDFLIPVDIKPMSDKVRDRHVIELIAHLALIEEIEGTRPPYGILLMGPSKRRVKIDYSEQKQKWLEGLVAEMRAIIDGVPAVPAPDYYKCRNCDVHNICEHSAFKPEDAN